MSACCVVIFSTLPNVVHSCCVVAALQWLPWLQFVPVAFLVYTSCLLLTMCFRFDPLIKHCVATVMSINVIVLVHRSTFRWMSSDPKACSLVPRESGYPQWYFNDLLYCLLFMAVKTLSRLTSSDKILTRWEYNSTVYWFKKLL